MNTRTRVTVGLVLAGVLLALIALAVTAQLTPSPAEIAPLWALGAIV